MNAQRKQQIEQYILAYNAFDVPGMCENLHIEVVFENISNGQVNLTTNGIAEFRKQAEAAKAYFKQREQSITASDFQDDVVTVNINYVGILAIDLPNGMKAGETMQLTGQSTFEFKDGKIIKIQDKS